MDDIWDEEESPYLKGFDASEEIIKKAEEMMYNSEDMEPIFNCVRAMAENIALHMLEYTKETLGEYRISKVAIAGFPAKDEMFKMLNIDRYVGYKIDIDVSVVDDNGEWVNTIRCTVAG